MSKKIFWVLFTLVFIVFAVLYSITSIIPHVYFKTAALDLGMFNHALYSFAHFKSNTFTLSVSGSEIPYLGDHFSPITILYGPFYYLFGEYTLLIIQILAILAGGYGIFKYSINKGLNRWMSLLLTIHFFTIFGIYSALNFDFHNNVIAAMLVPWFFYFFDKGQLKWMLFFYLLIILAKENMALWMTFILLGLILRKEYSSSGISKKTAALLMVFSAIYFIIVMQFIMPALIKGMEVGQLGRYSHIGGSLSEIAVKLWRKPDKFFVMLFENTIGLNEGLGVKSQLHFLVLVSGGLAFFRRPHFLVMLIPIYAQKMFSNSLTFWSDRSQYSIEFVPIISLAVISLIFYYKDTKWSWAIILILIYTTVHFNEKNLRLLKKEHYIADVDFKRINQQLKLIPDDAIISVNSMLAPHLAFRDKIYLFPKVKDATYIALIKKRSFYPLSGEDFQKHVNKIRIHPASNVLIDNDDIIIARITSDFTKKIDYSKSDPDYWTRIDEIKQFIIKNKDWYNSLEGKAIKRHITVDSMLNIDAKYVYENKYAIE